MLRQDCTFVMLCWPPKSHRSDQQFLLSRRVIRACLLLLHIINQWFSTFSLKGAKSRLTTLLGSCTGDILTQFNANIDTFCLVAERSLLHKILEVLLKYWWEPHKRFLGAACSSQNSGWKPQIQTVWYLLVVQHLKWLWRRVSNVDCCSQFDRGKTGI